MARYIGGSVGVAAIAMIYNAATVNPRDAGESASDALAAGLAGASLAMAILCASASLISLPAPRHKPRSPRPSTRPRRRGDRHTIPTRPAVESREPVAA